MAMFWLRLFGGRARCNYFAVCFFNFVVNRAEKVTVSLSVHYLNNKSNPSKREIESHVGMRCGAGQGASREAKFGQNNILKPRCVLKYVEYLPTRRFVSKSRWRNSIYFREQSQRGISGARARPRARFAGDCTRVHFSAYPSQPRSARLTSHLCCHRVSGHTPQ